MPPEQRFRIVDPSYRPKNKIYGGGGGGDIVYTWSYIAWCIMGTAVYFCLSVLPTESAKFIPDIDTGSQLYESFYYRYLVNTTYFPLGQLFSFWICCIMGWTFVNLVSI